LNWRPVLLVIACSASGCRGGDESSDAAPDAAEAPPELEPPAPTVAATESDEAPGRPQEAQRIAEHEALDALDQAIEVEGRRRGAEIRDELGALAAHAWAGSYYRGDQLGINETLVLAPVGGFVFQQTGCVKDYACWNYGTVREERGRLQVEPVLPAEKIRPVPALLVPVRVGERRYLIEEGQIERFERDVAQGRIDRQRLGESEELLLFAPDRELYFLNRADESLSATGPMVYPEGSRARRLRRGAARRARARRRARGRVRGARARSPRCVGRARTARGGAW
jgi:hypothetical protein